MIRKRNIGELSDSNHIEAIIEVREIIDEFTIKAYVNTIEDVIEVEFENIVDYKCGSRIKLIGSLELDIVED